MKFLIHLIAESGVGQQVQEIACLERKEHRLEDVGLTLREAKKLLGAIGDREKSGARLDCFCFGAQEGIPA